MVRLLGAIGVAAVALLQSVVALAAPTPSPSLDGILLSPPGSGFVEADKNTPGIFEGAFDSTGYATITSSTNSAQAKQTLDSDGFLSGYGRTWVSQSTHHIYVEAVMAFVGGSGAKTWLGQSELADKAESTYQHSITMSGIGTYYGARLVDSVNSVYADAYVFLKGNDTYLVSTVSTSDDLATTAAAQAKRQFDSAPPYTVPPSEWPEAKVTSAAFSVGKFVGEALFVILIVALIIGTALYMRSRRRPALIGVPAYGGAASAPILPPVVQMSEDRGSWWDGTTWRDAAREVPPHALLSADAAFWWDGQTWRAVPSQTAG